MIGKRGGTAQSVRTLLRALGTKNDARYNLKIVNNDGFTGAQSSEEGVSSGSAVEKPTEEAVESQSSYAENARKELAELDDLDI